MSEPPWGAEQRELVHRVSKWVQFQPRRTQGEQKAQPRPALHGPQRQNMASARTDALRSSSSQASHTSQKMPACR